jgi:ubiquinone/menaquinone biosynthesis C-methylase UbiE
MPMELLHELKVPHNQDTRARQDFVSTLRGYILNDMAAGMKSRYRESVEPALTSQLGRAPATQDEVHAAMKGDLFFKFYSAVRYNAQEMVWRSVIPGIEAALPDMGAKAEALGAKAGGSLALKPDLELPENVTAVDVHLMPGVYAAPDTPAAGAVYDNGLAVFSAGFMGRELNDIGMSMANYVRKRFPDFAPTDILDCGCTVGHNTLAWARTYPEATVHGIDVSSSVLRYAHARAGSLEIPAHFHQMDATSLAFPDASFDVVFSSMFLHELSVKDIKRFFAEAHRVLRPGGLLVNMELPPNQALEPYDQFYLDWDCYYNAEPFYRAFRDQDYAGLTQAGGFAPENFLQFTVPQYTYMDDADFTEAVQRPASIDGETGRLSATLQWFGFGAWKR